MKVILLKDVKKLGKKDQIVEVADGYGMNYLIPNKLAVVASHTGREILSEEKKEKAAERQKEKDKAIEDKKTLESLTLEFAVKTGDNGRVFGSVSTKQIEANLKKEHNIVVNRRKFKPSKALVVLGLHTFEVTLFPNVVAELKVRLVEES